MKITLSESSTLINAIEIIESSARRIAVVLSTDNKVIGTLTDGDIRRHILNGGNLNDKSIYAMNKNPVLAKSNTSHKEIKKLLQKHNIRALPVIGLDNVFLRILHEDDLDFENIKRPEKCFDAAVIMAGGEGMRLRPLTKDMPKPMIDINGIPLLERQILKLSKMGIKKIFISVNYLADVIKDHLKDGASFDVMIEYIHETKKLGTAGALSLLPEGNHFKDIIVINGDILTTSDFQTLYDFHKSQNAIITISAIDYKINIPFGVLEFEEARVKSIKEKPSEQFFCNAGIYAISTNALKLIPENEFYNMTDLIDVCIKDETNVSVFPVHEFWSDIGTAEDLKQARKNFEDQL